MPWQTIWEEAASKMMAEYPREVLLPFELRTCGVVYISPLFTRGYLMRSSLVVWADHLGRDWVAAGHVQMAGFLTGLTATAVRVFSLTSADTLHSIMECMCHARLKCA